MGSKWGDAEIGHAWEQLHHVSCQLCACKHTLTTQALHLTRIYQLKREDIEWPASGVLTRLQKKVRETMDQASGDPSRQHSPLDRECYKRTNAISILGRIFHVHHWLDQSTSHLTVEETLMNKVDLVIPPWRRLLALATGGYTVTDSATVDVLKRWTKGEHSFGSILIESEDCIADVAAFLNGCPPATKIECSERGGSAIRRRVLEGFLDV